MHTRAVLGGGIAAISLASLVAGLLLSAFDADVEPRHAAQGADASAGYEAPYLVLDVDPALRESISATAQLLAIELDVPVNIGKPPDDAPTITASSQKPPNARGESVVDHWGAFVSFWGDIEAWDTGSSEPLLLPTERSEALLAMLGPAIDAANVHWMPASEIVDHFAAGGDGVAILPSSSADERIRSVPAGGVDLVRGIGDVSASPLAQRMWWTWGEDVSPAFAEALVERVNVAPPPVTRVLITGDVIPARCIYARHRALDDYTAAFAQVGDALSRADITVGSLDAAISDAGTPAGCEQTFNLLAPPRSVEGLAAAGYDVITVATNHAKDCGSTGIICNNRSFLDTLANLKAAGIAPVGGGTDLTSARKPVVVERNGVRFAFLGYDDVSSAVFGATKIEPGTAPLTVANVLEDIEAAKQQADVVIVLPQWGVEYTSMPNARQTELAQVAIEVGATIVAGNHPHVVQGVEWFETGFAAYALGNFVFDQDWSLETQQGAVLEATFHGARLAGVRLVPVRIRNMYQPTWATGDEARSILDRMRRSSEVVSDRRQSLP